MTLEIPSPVAQRPDLIGSDAYAIQREHEPETANKAILDGLLAYNLAQTGEKERREVVFTLRDDAGEVVGGVSAGVIWSWMHIGMLWVRDDLRGRGFGRKLMDQAESAARELGLVGIFLDTLSFQAPEFYARLGYETLGVLDGFPPGGRLEWMAKRL